MKKTEASETTQRFFYWLPAAVHYTVVLLPMIIFLAMKLVLGINWAIASCIMGVWYMYLNILHPYKAESKTRLNKACVNPKTKKRAAVIGGGPSGIVTSKELLHKGIEVVAYDDAPVLGGTFASKFWTGGFLTSSPYVTAFSDYEPKPNEDGTPHLKHHSKEEYVQYLQDYADDFGVSKCYRLRHRIMEVIPKRSLDGEEVYYLRVRALDEPQDRIDGPFDHIAVCSGSFNVPFIPRDRIQGFHSFHGKVLHTVDFSETRGGDSTYQALANKKVVVVGLGESMADILGLMMKHQLPKECLLSTREGAFIIPRTNPLTGLNNDFDSTRLRYSLIKWIHNLTIVVCSYLTLFRKTSASWKVRFEMLRQLRTSSPAYKTTTKSDNFVRGVVEGHISLKPSVERIEGNRVFFEDGTSIENVDVLLFGTGYRPPVFPYFQQHLPSLNEQKPRFLKIFDPVNTKFGFIGLGVRPLVGSIPTIAEMQARIFAQVVSGDLELPSEETMSQSIAADIQSARREFQPHNESWKNIVNWIPYMDSLAKELGCLPPRQWLFNGLGRKLLFGPMSSFHYRLCGPDSKPEYARRVIQSLPNGARIQDQMFFFALHAATGMIRWPLLVLSLISNADFGLLETLQARVQTKLQMPRLGRRKSQRPKRRSMMHDPMSSWSPIRH